MSKAKKKSLITFAEFIRRRYTADSQEDPTAKRLPLSTLYNKIKSGDITVEVQNNHRFIDWEAYKDFPFVRYGNR